MLSVTLCIENSLGPSAFSSTNKPNHPLKGDPLRLKMEKVYQLSYFSHLLLVSALNSYRKTSFNLLHRPGVHYGSYYLRIGTLCKSQFPFLNLSKYLVFGIGSLIYTGIEIGDNFEARFLNNSDNCTNTSSVVRSYG